MWDTPMGRFNKPGADDGFLSGEIENIHPDKNPLIFVRVIRRRRTIVRSVFCSHDIGTGDDWLHAQNVSGFCWDHPQTNVFCSRTIVQNIRKTCLTGQNIVSEQMFLIFAGFLSKNNVFGQKSIACARIYRTIQAYLGY
jgi:hypothetical protein